jgi:hypothetical protein
MSKGDTLENDILKKLFNNISLSWDAITDLYLSLHTGDPGEGGDQTTNEATYTGYARISVARGSAGFTISGNQVTNTAVISFPQCSGGNNTVTHVAIGTAATAAGQLLYSGALAGSLAISNLITPQFPIGALVVMED